MIIGVRGGGYTGLYWGYILLVESSVDVSVRHEQRSC